MNTHNSGAIVKLERILRYFLDPGPYMEQLGNFIPFFLMIPYGQSGPSIAEYPAQHIRQAIDKVSCHSKDPDQAAKLLQSLRRL